MKMYKRIFGVLLCLCMLLGAVSLAGAEENTTGGGTGTGENTGHRHVLCYGTACTDPNHDSHSDVSFDKKLSQGEDGTLYIGEEEWEYSNNNGYLLPAGTYYLGTDLTLDHEIRIKEGNVILCLNGKTITRTNDGAVIKIQSVTNDATFTLCNCGSEGMITHTENSTYGSGVDVSNSNRNGSTDKANFIMYNGHITQNKGSGVYLNANTMFTMYGGSITKNNADRYGYGGGVCVNSEVTFTMYGGTIADNYASMRGGGVSTSGATANFTMHGGTITENHANTSGGGIYSGNASFAIYGGSITNNSVNRATTRGGETAGGIYVPASGTLTVGGNVNISGNWQGDSKESGSNSNVYLDGNTSGTSATIVIEKTLTGAPIGVTTATSVATKDTSIKIAAGGSYTIKAGDENYFTPDAGNDYCKVEIKTDGIYLTHVHSGGTATCMAKAKCGGCRQPYGDLDPTNHSYSTKWSHDGTYHWHECSRCNAKDAEISHTYNQEVVASGYLKTAATCKQYAVYYKSCICGAQGTDADTFEHVIGGWNAANHKGTPSAEWTGKDETKHWKVWSCCGAQVSGTDEAHNGTKWTVGEVTTPATCMTAGVRTYTCEVCGKVKTEEISATGHDFTGDTYLSNDTQHWKKCKDCGFEDTAHPESHNVVTDEAKPATTTETGLTEGKHCDVCGKVLVAQEVTPKLTPRYYYNSTTTTTKDTTKKDNTKSPVTFDPGVGVYALTAVLSVTGMAWVGRKKH